MAMQRTSFRSPWALVLVLFLLACGIGVAGYLSYLDHKKGIRQEKQNELLAVVELKSRSIADWRSDHLDDSRVILNNPLLLPLLDRWLRNGAAPSSLESGIRQWMTSRQRNYHYDNILLLDPAGVPLISVPSPSPYPLTPFHRSMIRKAVENGKAVFSDVYRETSTGVICYEAFIPLRAANGGAGRTIAVMLIHSDPRRSLFPLVRSWPTSSRTAETLLVSREGDAVVYLNQPRRLRDGSRLPRLPLSEQPLMAAAAARGRDGIVEGLDYRGVPVIAAVKRIPDSPWFLVVKVDADEVYAPLRERARLLGGLTAALMLAAGVCMFLLWRQARLGFYRELYEAEREHMAAAHRTEQELQLKQQELEALNRGLEQRVRQELERNREKDHLLIQQCRLAAMGEMIGNIAHQWRQPLNVVGLLFQSLPESRRNGELTDEHLDETVRQAMEVIGYMSRTINDFRNFFSPDKGKSEFFVQDVVDRSISFLQPHFHYHNIEITVRITDGLSMSGYPNEYAQVLINILGNAKDIFLERGTENPSITVSARQEGGRTVVTITDNAGGVPEGILSRIFDPYFTCKQSGDGTGLGLYMSKTIIEKNMRGILTARNTECGAEFRIEV